MERIKDFRYNELALWAKGFYNFKHDDFFRNAETLIRLNKDYYFPAKRMSRQEVTLHFLKALDIIYSHFTEREMRMGMLFFDRADFYLEVNNKMLMYNVDQYEATCLVVMSIMFDLNKDEIELKRPVYGRGLPRLYQKHGMTYTEMYRKVARHFPEPKPAKRIRHFSTVD